MRHTPALSMALGLFASACVGAESAPTTQAEAATTTTVADPGKAVGPVLSTATPPNPPAVTAGPASPTTPNEAPTTILPATTIPPATTIDLGSLVLGLEEVASGFDQPVFLTSPPGDERLFVVDQPGRIWFIDGTGVHEFLDIRDEVRFAGEMGLLGLAFHPAYAENGLFYIDHTDGAGDSVLAEYRIDPVDPNRADSDSRRVIMEVDQPAGNHNGGMLAFGPDGHLWFGLGDGGGANDQYRNGQRSDRRLGSMLRILVGPGAPESFGVPDGGPFEAEGGLPEVWAIGLRNPWRFSFDGDALYLADVGQASVEEINVVQADVPGLNYGWPILEGNDCFGPSLCERAGLVEPIAHYHHNAGCSVIGGYVYRGAAIPELDGHYIYGDFCGGWVRSLVMDEGRVMGEYEWFPPDTLPFLTSFGVDGSGEIYAIVSSGIVYRIVRG